jgi:hypothetical protein
VGIASEGISRTTVFNRRPITLGVQYYYNVERPEGSAGHTLRFAVTLCTRPPSTDRPEALGRRANGVGRRSQVS